MSKTPPETFVAQVIADGRITIPEKLRTIFGIENGDFIRMKLIEKVNRPKEREGGKASHE